MASTSRPIVYYHFLLNKFEQEDEQNKEMNIDSNGGSTKITELMEVSAFNNRNKTPKLHLPVLFNDAGPWEIKKDLTKSDIGPLSRLLLPSEDVKNYIFSYWDSELVDGVENHDVRLKVTVRDFDTLTDHQLVFRKWRSNGSYIFQENWSSQFVRRRSLQANDEIGMFWNPIDSFFVFKVIKRANPSSSSSMN